MQCTYIVKNTVADACHTCALSKHTRGYSYYLCNIDTPKQTCRYACTVENTIGTHMLHMCCQKVCNTCVDYVAHTM